ncbi:MAG: leucine--tRNA ligase, partial [Anaerolineae bacterium]|nr:leucine--tRNA ligase [Anaerolineae bacterium]
CLLGYGYSIHTHQWPPVDEEAAKDELITLVVQINGKVRDRIEVPADIDEAQAKELALAREVVSHYLQGRSPKQVIVVPGRLVSIVV